MTCITFFLLLASNSRVRARRQNRQRKSLLALGDSLADGQIAPGFVFSSGSGFNDFVFAKLQNDYGFDTLANGGCSAETTQNFLNSTLGLDSCEIGEVSLCYSNLCNTTLFPKRFQNDGISQMDATEIYLQQHPGEVGMVTISIGINDVTGCLSGSQDELQACVLSSMTRVSENLVIILNRLLNALSSTTPTGEALPPVIGMTYYNPLLANYLPGGDPALAILSEFLSSQFNDAVLRNIFSAFNIPVVDAYTAIHGSSNNNTASGIRNDVLRLCKYTDMCETVENRDGSAAYILSEDLVFSDAIHPNEEGYALIGEAFLQVIKEQELLAPLDQTELPTSMPTIHSDDGIETIPTIAPIASTAMPTLPPTRQPTKPTSKKSGKKKKGKKGTEYE